MNKYRSHNCNELRKTLVGQNVTLSGWINKKRDHGNLLFIDLRDNYGVTQCIIDKDNSKFNELEKMQLETVVKIENIFKEIDLISYYSIKNFDKDYIYYEIIFNGTPQNFIKIMNDRNYNFDTQNKIWILK